MKKTISLIAKFSLIWLFFVTVTATAQTTNETFISGAYIIDMGQSSQTVAKGLKPYGLVYTLIKDHNVPVRWSINPTKVKDGTDFTVNSKAYKGGTFIIPAQYVSASVLSKINTWKAKGVIVDGPINVSFTAPIYGELTSWPRAVLDEDNGSIAAGYYSKAEVPTSSYTLAGNPTMLSGCDDIYVLPHADPHQWVSSWKTALDNYVKSGGYLWAACHAVSALEANTPTYLGFKYLSTNGLIPWGSHGDGSGSYTYNPSYNADPIMQFMGTIDAATTNGSEQIYIPYKGASDWRPTTKVAVYQPSHSQADPNEAAVLVYGRAYGNSNYGMVMYEAGHDHAKKNDPANIAAQRAYFNFLLMSGIQKQPEVTTNIPSTVYSGEVLNLSASVTGGSGPYTYAWSSSCAGGSFTNPNSANATYTAPVVNSITDCIITVIVTDNCGRFSIASETVVVMPPQADLMVVKTVSNSTPVVGTNVTFTITATNNGQNNATGVVVNDVLPSGYTFVSATPSTGSWSAPNWTIGNLANGASATLAIVATVKTTGNYANTATISGTQTDPTPGNNSSTVTPVPVSAADLAVVKSVSNATPNVGSNVTFTITASNNGPSAATGVTVNDVLPSGYTFVSATPSTGSWSAPNWTIGNLANGGSATLSIVATVKASGSYANTATITGSETDPTPGNNSSTSTPVPVGVTDLAVVKTVSNATPNVGSNITFTITATNNGPSSATGVSVNDVLPSGYTFVSASPSTGSWSAPNWTIGNLANGGSATLSIVATVNANGPYANTATISGSQTDPTPGNNSSTSTPVPVAITDLGVVKTVSNATPNVGSNVTFTITASNNGPSNATSVVVNDVLPSGYTFVSATPSAGSWAAPNWTIGNLANGGNATLTIVATVKASGTYANTASITGGQNDPNTANNSSTATPVPVANADLAVLKTVNNNAPNVGDNVTFTITASNNGPSNATSVVVNDALPSGYTFVSATPSAGSWAAPNWTIGNLANGANATLTIVATVKASGNYTNTASISGGQPDPVWGNNSSSVTPVPAAVADLAVVKTVNNATPKVGDNVTFTITASNNGPSAATGVVVNDVIPAGYTLVSATPSSGSWSAPNWTIGNLANGANATLSIVASVNSGGAYANTATIDGDQTDPAAGNNSSTSTPTPGPNAINDNASTSLNTPVDISILSNDLAGAAALNPASVTFVAGTTPNPATVGTFTVNNAGLVTFTPAFGFTGTATVDYQVCDANALCDIATITVVVNTVPGPTAVDDNATTTLNTAVTIPILSNDEAGAAALNPASVTFVAGTTPNPATVGTFTVNNAGLVTFTPVFGYTGTTTVDYQVCDANALCDIATITVVVNTVPGPTAVDDNASTTLNTPVDINVLANDVAGAAAINPASVTLVAGTTPNPTTQGSFTVNPTTGLVTFTPVTGFTGTVTADYQVCDANALCDIATITVVVNTVPGPTAVDDNASTTLNTPVDINVLANDVAGAAAINPASVTLVAGTTPNPTTQGSFTVNPTTGLVTFTPVTGFTGTVTADYQVCDANALCDIATITVVVNTVPGPTAVDDNASTDMNTPVDINVLANDVAGAAAINPASVTLVAGTTPNPTTQGTFTVNPTTGLVTFTPVTGFTGTVTADYQVCDANALCDIATITVVVNTVAGPDAQNDAASTIMNTPVEIDVLQNDVVGVAAIDPASVTLVAGTEPDPATQGSFSVDPITGKVTFTPVNGFLGNVSVNYQVCDLNGLCDIATITVTVIPGTDILYPATGFGTLAYEDLWPGKGDYDFNDLVIDYQFRVLINTNNNVESVTGTFIIKAFGASYENGFGFQLSDAIEPADLTVTGFELTESFIELESNGTESGLDIPTIIVYDNAYNQMEHPGIGIGVNTTPGAPYVTPDTLVIQIDFKPNTYSFNDLDIANFNPFLIVNKVRSHEVHLPYYAPTAKADAALFGQWEDNSNPASGRYYVNDKNLPWAINIYESFAYPIEKQEILWAHLKFAEWAMSGGVQFPDWYKNLAGYRNNTLIYQIPEN